MKKLIGGVKVAQNIFKIYGDKVSFSQWEKRQKLIVLNESVQEVHFSNKNMMHSIQRDVYRDTDGLMVCNVPDDLLKLPINLVADAYIGDVLIKSVKFAVTKRPIPGDYVSDQSDVDEHQDQRISVLEKSMGGTADLMHFKGKMEELPGDMSGYISGDVISVGKKDYVFDGIEFIEIGDSSTHHEHSNKKTLDNIDDVLASKLSRSELNIVVDDILLQAKISGHFNGKDGVDGYTPIKGVDYFDGVDGKDGNNGIDGYTPVKGVDYFDGQNGKDGDNGNDGVSATHSWNGTVLTITSAAGTSSTDLKGEKGERGEKGEQGIQGLQGEKGDKGDKGDIGATGKDGENGKDGYTPIKGTDYYTESDKQEIVNLVLAALPNGDEVSY